MGRPNRGTASSGVKKAGNNGGKSQYGCGGTKSIKK